jgi:hypothetical protein
LKTEKKTFIVSIYRSDENDPEKLIGIVEDAITENERRAFLTKPLPNVKTKNWVI